MRVHTRLLARAREGRPGVPFALVVGVAGGLLIANLFAGGNAGSRSQAGTGGTGLSGVAGGGAGAAPGASAAPAASGGSGGVPGAPGAAAAAGAAAGAGAAPGSSTATAGGGTGGAPGSGPAAGGTAAGGGGATARGVTATSITVGVAYLDLSGVQYLGPDYNVGNVPEQWKALIDGWHRQHLLPVNGRDINLTFHSFSVLQPSAQRSVCAAMVQDDQVFAAVAPEYFYQYGAECLAAEYHTPLITSDGPTDDVYQRGAPFLYTIMPSSNQQLENMVYWANSKGMLNGSTIGVYHLNDPNVQLLVDQSLKATLSKLGHPVAAEQTTNDANGGPEDAVAVQDFRTRGVNLAIVMTSNIGFMQQASVQHYKPQYIGSDYNGYTTYLQGADYPKDEFGGSYAVTTTDRGLDGSGAGLTPSQQACIDNYNRYSGQHLGRQAGYGTHDTAELVYVLLSCDEGALLLHALQQAGPQLTGLSFAAGMQTVRDMPMNYFPAVTFGSGKYTGVTQEATVQWMADCTCWVRRGSFSGLSRPS